MKIKNLVLTAFVSMSAVLATGVKANSVELYSYSYEYGGGGEITAVTSPSFLNYYAPAAIVNGGFETFCTEVYVDATTGTPYSFSLSSETTQGNQLSVGAAYLYYLFGTGNLSDYNYSDNPLSPYGSRLSDAESLQTAIWALMNQPNYFGQDLAADPYLNLAYSVYGAGMDASNNGQFPVDIMQIWDPNNVGSPAPYGYQNQLVIVGVGDGGSTVLMLGMCLTLIAFAGSRIRPLAV